MTPALIALVSGIHPMATAPSEPVSAGEAISRPVIVLLVILGAFVLTRLSRVVLRRVVRYVARRSMVRPSQWWKTRTRYGEHELAGVGENRQRQRIDAAARMLHHLFAVVLWVGVLIAVFHILELNATFFLSSAGFIGAAVAIGGQHKVNDYLTGLSVLLEDRYGVGDEIEILGANSLRGVVEHIGLVSTRVRDGYSTVHLPHVALLSVRNLSQEPAETKLSIQMPLETENAEAAAKAAETIRELAGSQHLTGVVLVDDIEAQASAKDDELLEVRVRTARPLTAAERETIVRRTEERLSAQDT